jgi:hypothetical protein
MQVPAVTGCMLSNGSYASTPVSCPGTPNTEHADSQRMPSGSITTNSQQTANYDGHS